MEDDALARIDGHDNQQAATVTIYPDGPLVLRGQFEIHYVDGSPVPTSRVVALCRCGNSALKPLCDGSHKHGFGSRRAATQVAPQGDD